MLLKDGLMSSVIKMLYNVENKTPQILVRPQAWFRKNEAKVWHGGEKIKVRSDAWASFFLKIDLLTLLNSTIPLYKSDFFWTRPPLKIKTDQPHPHDYSTHRQTPSTDNERAHWRTLPSTLSPCFAKATQSIKLDLLITVSKKPPGITSLWIQRWSPNLFSARAFQDFSLYQVDFHTLNSENQKY